MDKDELNAYLYSMDSPIERELMRKLLESDNESEVARDSEEDTNGTEDKS